MSDRTSIQSMMLKKIIFSVGGWGGGGGWWWLGQVKFLIQRIWKVIFFYKESKSNNNNKILAVGRGGRGGVATVRDFFFQKNPSLKKRISFQRS